MRVLVVKMSSLGDVVHTLPALADAWAALEGRVTFDWVVEEAFRAIPERHPAVTEVIPIAWRRWRRRLRDSGGELRRFAARLRRERYDLVIDAQGLVKSAAVTALARRRSSAGLDRASAREGAASLVYRRRIHVSRDRHAVDRVRMLFAGALGYPPPAGPPDFGFRDASRVDAGSGACVLLHGTTWPSKQYPLDGWVKIARLAAAAGHRVLVPWGDEAERQRAERLAAAAPAEVLDRQPLAALADTLAGAAVAIGVDSGLTHLAAALDVPTVGIYGPTSSRLTGVRGGRARSLQADFPGAPCLSRPCRDPGQPSRRRSQAVDPACYASLPPERVWGAAEALLTEREHADRLLHL